MPATLAALESGRITLAKARILDAETVNLSEEHAAAVEASADTLWRLCVRGIEPHDANQRVTVRGSTELAQAVLQIVSIIR